MLTLDCSVNFCDIVAFINVVISLFAFIVAFKKYNEATKRNKAKVLTEFNQRYTTDRILSSVTKWFTEKAYEEQLNSNSKRNNNGNPSHYDIETYCRFGEELEIAIRKNYLEEMDVKNMFWYYLDKAFDYIPEEDKTNGNWELFISLKNRMNKLNK